MLTQLVIYLLLGAVTGVLSGLFGIGGGTVIVPALIVMLTAKGVSTTVLTHMAIGSSLATISFTALSSIHAHHQRAAVQWRWVWRLVPGVCLGVWIGAAIAHQLSGVMLQKAFAVFLLLIAAQMWWGFPSRKDSGAERLTPLPVLGAAGFLIGLLSAFFGIGGGSLTVPFLHSRGMIMKWAAATAAAVGFPIALVGACGYFWQGRSSAGLPEFSSGFIYWPAVVGIATSSVVFAKVGAHWAHALEAQKLKRIFVWFLFAIGIWFLLHG